MKSSRKLRNLLRAATPALVIAVMGAIAMMGGVGGQAGVPDVYTLQPYACGGGSGQFDERGYMYLPCKSELQIMDPDGNVVQRVAGAFGDVAPSPDGKFFYSGNWGTAVTRHNLQEDGSYIKDATWAPEKFTYGNVARDVRMTRIATDAFGDLYISSGYWAGDLGVVLKYRPDGKFVTLFGAFTDGNAALDINNDGIKGDDPLLWKQGQFYWNVAGLAVSRDGKNVYSSEVGNNRVQRWEYQLDGTYRSKRMWGNTAVTDPQRKGSCAKGLMAAPYDVGTDPWGYVYVTNTTCTQVQKFDPDGQWQYSMWVGTNGPAATGPGRSHTIAVDSHGSVYSTETNRLMKRTSAEPGEWPAIAPLPAPDITAPVLTSATVPASTTARGINVTTVATDNTGVTEIRTANEDGEWGAWRAYAPQVTHTLSAGYATKGVFVQVKDGAELESAVLYKTLSYKADEDPPMDPNPGPDAAPVLTSIVVPATSATSNIGITINATDNKPLVAYRFASEDGNWQAWKTPFTDKPTFVASAGTGTKGVFVQVRDSAGQASNTIYRTFTVTAAADPNPDPNPDPDPDPDPDPVPNPDPNPDPVPVNTPPAVTALALPAVTPTQVVNVTLRATDDKAVTHMRFANEDGTWKAWRAYAEGTTHELNPGRLTKGVFAQVRDADGRESNTMFKTTLCDPCTAPAVQANGRIAQAASKIAKSARRVFGNAKANRLKATPRKLHVDSSNRDGKRDIVTCAPGASTILMRPEDQARKCGKNDRVSVVREPRGIYGR